MIKVILFALLGLFGLPLVWPKVTTDIEIAIRRDQLAQTGENEFYWSHLQGLAVVTQEKIELGVVSHLFETGSNDVLVVKGERERLIPFILDQVIKQVDLEEGRILVDWDPDF